jgi:hypothetical protein
VDSFLSDWSLNDDLTGQLLSILQVKFGYSNLLILVDLTSQLLLFHSVNCGQILKLQLCLLLDISSQIPTNPYPQPFYTSCLPPSPQLIYFHFLACIPQTFRFCRKLQRKKAFNTVSLILLCSNIEMKALSSLLPWRWWNEKCFFDCTNSHFLHVKL